MGLTLVTIEAELPSGRTVKLREPRSSDEMGAACEGIDLDPISRELVCRWSLMKRCTVMLDGQEFSQETTPEKYRDLFNSRDFVKLTEYWHEIFRIDEETQARCKSSKRLGAESA